MPDVAVGYYRHWKGGLYEVEVSDAQDANGTDWWYRNAFHVDEQYFPDGRHVVIYRSVSDGSVWVRTTEDFMAWVNEKTGLPSAQSEELAIQRFTYLGVELTGEMLSE